MSGVLVPAQGWSAAFRDLDTQPRYRIMGPFSPGCIIDRLVWRIVGVRTVQNFTTDFGAVVTGSSAADIGGWQSGAPVVQRSVTRMDGIPVARFPIFFSVSFEVQMAVGVPVTSGSVYVLAAALASTADERIDAFVTVFASAVKRVTDEPLVPSSPVALVERGR